MAYRTPATWQEAHEFLKRYESVEAISKAVASTYMVNPNAGPGKQPKWGQDGWNINYYPPPKAHPSHYNQGGGGGGGGPPGE